MPVIINEVEVIAPPPSATEGRPTSPEANQTPGPTPLDIYWTVRKVMERQMRLHAR
jgi:hypothetical protein